MAYGVTPFSPSPVGTVALAVTSASASVALPPLPGDGPVAVTNAVGGAICFLKFGLTAAVAAAVPVAGAASGDYPLLPGTTQILERGSAGFVAAIGTTGTTLYFTTGQGS